jgi:hypothetical protein
MCTGDGLALLFRLSAEGFRFAAAVLQFDL